MPNSRDIRAGGAFVEFSLRRKGLERSLRAVARRMQRFGANVARVGAKIAALGGVITAPFALATRTFAKVGDELDKMSRRTGFSVEALSELGFAAGQSGSDMATLEKGIKGMQRSIVDLGRGLSTQKDAFDALGLTFERLDGLAPDKQFETIAEALSKVEDPTLKAALSMQVFGRAGQQLIPLLSGGADGIAALRAEAQRLGLTIDGKTAKSAADLTDAIARLKGQVKVAAVNVGAALAPALIRAASVLSTAGRGVIDFIKANGKLIASIAAAGAALIVIGTAIVGIGTAFIVAGAVVSGFATVLGLVLSPLGLLVAGVVAATVALFKFTDLGSKAVNFLAKRFAFLNDVATRAFAGIKDALTANNILLAARTLWVGLKIAFFEGTRGLFTALADLKDKFHKTSTEIGAGMIAVFSNAFAKLSTLALDVSGFFAKAFVRVEGDFREMTNLMINLAKKAGITIRERLDPTFSGSDADAARARVDAEFVAAQKADQSLTRSRIAAIDSVHTAAVSNIEAERQARENAIADSLAADLESIKTASDADRQRIQDRINGLRKERDQLEALAKGRATLERLQAFFRSGGPGDVDFTPAGTPDIGEDIAQQINKAQAAASQGITSSFNIRGLGNSGIQPVVEQIARKADKMARHLRDIDLGIREGVQAGGLAIT